MSTSAEGVVENAAIYTGRVRAVRYIRIAVYNIFGAHKTKSFRIEIGGEILEGKTSEKGEIEIAVPESATDATLYVEDEVYTLKLVDDQPTETIEWTKTRLCNLGFDCGQIDGEWGFKSQTAMKLFQQLNGLKPTGMRDKESLDLLEKLHDQKYEDTEEQINEQKET